VDTLTSAEARALALTASLGPVPRSSAGEVLRQLGLLQLDPLARVDKAHRLTCLARLTGAVTPKQIDQALWSDAAATAFETWVHAACLVPIDDWPLLNLYRNAVRASPKRPEPAVLDQVRSIVAAHPGGATISDIEEPGAGAKGWEWSARKHATEHMLRTGELVCTARRGPKRVFDLPERRVPSDLLNAVASREEILGGLATRALRALGVATAGDVAVYYNLNANSAETGLRACGAIQVKVEGWRQPGWLEPHRADTPSETDRDPLLLGPFDNLIWDRARTKRIFGFDYTFEAYKPAAKRRYGYYVLALLYGDRFAGRADISRDHTGLHILSSHPEPDVRAADFDAILATAADHLTERLRVESEHAEEPDSRLLSRA